ncbi:MAG: amidohydrolase family protein, partial [Pseudomonadota bacterium]
MIDCHFHLDESLVNADGLVASMDAHGISRTAVIAPLCPDIEKRLILTLAGPLLRRALISGSATFRKAVVRFYGNLVKPGGQVDVGGKRYPIIPQPDNEAVARAVAARPDRLWGWIFVNPAGPADPATTVSRFAREPGMIGVKAHPFWHAYPTDMLREAAEAARRHSMPMLVHLGPGAHGDFAMLAASFKEVPFVFAHAGVPYPDEVCAKARKKDNVYVDLSAASYVDRNIA